MHVPNSFVVAMLLVAFTHSAATNGAVVNGDFENGASPWKTQTTAGQDCEPPGRVPGKNPAVGGNKVGELGPRVGSSGCESNTLYQTFNCSDTGAFCTVTFQAFFPAAGSEDKAFVNLGATSKRIPVAAGWQTYSISTAGCGNSVTIAFTLTGFGFPDHSLKIDNVTSACTANNQTSAALLNETVTVTPNANDPALADLHDVPGVAQVGDNGCGPAAATSCLLWWQANGFPNIKSRTGSNTAEGIRDQIADDADTDPETGTDLAKLAEAMNRAIDEAANNQAGAHKGQLKAKGTLAKSDVTDFPFLDSEFSKGEDVLMLISYRVNGKWINHFVTVRKVTGTGNTRSVTYMDPSNGQSKTTTVTKGANQLDLTHNGNPAKVIGFITMSPTVTVQSTTEPVTPQNPNGDKKIHYKVYYPSPAEYPEKLPKDLHIRVTDCNLANYQVTGLPAGWQTQVANAPDGKCYLTFYKSGSTTDIPNGAEIVVTYTGPDKVQEREQIITPTTSGVTDPAIGALPKQKGHAVVLNTSEPPTPGGRPRIQTFDSPQGNLAAILAWTPSEDPSVTGYAVFNNYKEELIATLPSPFFVIPGLEADTPYGLSVRAVTGDDYYSAPTEPVYLHRDELSELAIIAGGPQIIEFPPATMTFHLETQWQVSLPGALANGQLIVNTITGEPEPPHPTPDRLQETFYHQTSTVPLSPGLIAVTIPYSESMVHGPEPLLQVHLLDGGNWIDVTTSVDPLANLITATLPHLGTLVLVNPIAPPPIPSASTWTMLFGFAALVILGAVVMRNRKTRMEAAKMV